MLLAARPADLTTVGEIAEFYAISENHLTKIVRRLRMDGLIETVRGRNGGLRLVLKPAQINVGKIVRRYEDDMCIVECFDAETNTCPLAGACTLTTTIDEAISAFLATLDKKSLADIMEKSPRLRRKNQLTGRLSEAPGHVRSR